MLIPVSIRSLTNLSSSKTLRLLLAALLLTAAVAPSASWAKKSKKTEPQTYSQSDSTYQYVSTVFDKLQTYWSKQAAGQQIDNNSTLTFTLDSNGNVINSKANTASDPVASSALSFIKQNAPFGAFPESVEDQKLEFVFKLTPESMQMVSYRFLQKAERQDNVISMASPTSSTPGATSLFFARVVDTAEAPQRGNVDTSNASTSNLNADSQAMEQYVSEVRDRIRQQWRQPEGPLTFSPAMAMLQIDRDGSLLSATLTQSSGNKNIDRAIMNTIYQAGPFKQAPDALQSLPVTVEYLFEPVVSTVYEQGKP